MWDESLYTVTEIKEGDLSSVDNTPLNVLITEGDEEHPLESKFPELRDIQEEYGLLQKSHAIRTSNGWSKVQSHWIKAKLLRSNGGTDMFEILSKVKDDAFSESQREVMLAFNVPVSIESREFRKMVEAIFHHTEAKITLNKTVTENARKSKNRNSYAFVVDNKSGCGFNETLKDVKNALVKGGATSEVKSMRSARDGKVLVTLNNSKEAADRIQQALGSLATGNGVRTWRVGNSDIEVLHLKELDALTTQPEVIEALEEYLGLNSSYKVGKLRPMAKNTQAVTVTTTKGNATVLLKNKWLRIGLVNCRVEKRIQLQKCTKCWNYDQRSDKCTGPDR